MRGVALAALVAGAAAAQESDPRMGSWPVPWWEGAVATGETRTVGIEFRPGFTYRVDVWCSPGDFDLVVRDPAGASLRTKQDLGRGAVIVDPALPGRYEVEFTALEEAIVEPGCERWSLSVDHLKYGVLGQNESFSFPIHLRAGVSYDLFAWCDLDCGHLDLRLRGPDRTTVDESVSWNRPFVRYQPLEDGDFTVSVEMVNCTVEPCKWRVGGHPSREE